MARAVCQAGCRATAGGTVAFSIAPLMRRLDGALSDELYASAFNGRGRALDAVTVPGITTIRVALSTACGASGPTERYRPQ